MEPRKVTEITANVAVDTVYGCWMWRGAVDRDGYPRDESGRLAHRSVYEAERGTVPDGRELDHVCRRRKCVRPEHLEPVTRSENERRKSWRRRARVEACAAGHNLFTSGRRTPEGGKVCLACAPVEARQ